MVRQWWLRLRAGARLTLRLLADIPRILQILVQEIQRYGVRVATLYTVDHVYRLATGAPVARFSRVVPGVHIGGQYTLSGWRRLQARGVTAVVNLRDEFDDAVAGIAPDCYLFLPTVDDTPPSVAQLWQGVRFIEDQIRHGGEVYVHCMLGVGRSATLVIAYLIASGMSFDEALATLRYRRPFIQPTASQEARLREFEADVARIGTVGERAAVEQATAELFTNS
jgi:dual specificity MAP kinase phosphatase